MFTRNFLIFKQIDIVTEYLHVNWQSSAEPSSNIQRSNTVYMPYPINYF